MIEIMLAGIFIKAFILCLLLFFFARSEADFNFRKVSMVTAGLTLGSILLEGLLQDQLGVFVMIPIMILTVLILMKFCWVSWWKALIVALPFVGVSLGLSFFTADVTAKSSAVLTRSVTRGATTKDDVEELRKMHAANTDLSFLDNEPAKPDQEEGAAPSVEEVTRKARAVVKELGAAVSAPPTEPRPAREVNTKLQLPVGKPRRSSSAGRFNLSAISQGSHGRLAIINNNIVEQGQIIAGAKVLLINHDRVELQLGNELITLKIGEK